MKKDQAQKRLINRLFLPILILAAVLCFYGSATANAAKKTVGATEIIHIVESGLDFNTRIDTGARTTSVHALEIEIENPATDKKANIGKTISLTLVNEKGKKKRLKTKIVDALEVRNAQGVEVRYMIPLTLRWQGSNKTINVNLRDRSAMTYKLLIGRDWLSRDFIVDVDKNKGTKK
ncbi:MAG: ATP-dependent zinc protease [Deltaproteobacteria bacterium]|nr:ATP-dependent zinc protease [Candidatus Tharpella aukensis]